MKVTSAVQKSVYLGGQANFGLFGVPGFEPSRHPRARSRHARRIKGTLNSFERDGLSEAHYRRLVVPAPARCSSLDDEPEFAHGHWLADLAEARGCSFDEEAAAYARFYAGVGYTEHLMSLEG